MVHDWFHRQRCQKLYHLVTKQGNVEIGEICIRMTMHPLQQFAECYAYIVECSNHIASGNMNFYYICKIIVFIQFIQSNLD